MDKLQSLRVAIINDAKKNGHKNPAALGRALLKFEEAVIDSVIPEVEFEEGYTPIIPFKFVAGVDPVSDNPEVVITKVPVVENTDADIPKEISLDAGVLDGTALKEEELKPSPEELGLLEAVVDQEEIPVVEPVSEEATINATPEVAVTKVRKTRTTKK